MTTVTWLTPSDEELAQKMRAVVRNHWKDGPEHGEYTPHDPDHFARVESWIKRLVPPEKWHLLSPLERKILTWCAWTHDVAMLSSIAGANLTPSEQRNQHVEGSADWVADNSSLLGLTQLEAQIVAGINIYHSRQNGLKDCNGQTVCNGELTRPQLLAAYLRLADALDVAYDRVKRPHRYELLLHQISQEADTTLFHWIKSLVVGDIFVNERCEQIHIEFFDLGHFIQEQPKSAASVGAPAHSKDQDRQLLATFEVIKRYVVNEIEDELASVEKILSLGGISSFHTVSSSSSARIRSKHAEELRDSMQDLKTSVQISQSPSSTEISRVALDAITGLINRAKEISDDQKAWDLFGRGLQKLERSLYGQVKERACHIELKRIYNEVNTRLSEAQQSETHNSKPIAALKTFVDRFSTIVGPRLLGDDLHSILQEMNTNHDNSKPWTFLLYSCSETVANALALFEKACREKDCPDMRVAIAECRPKSQHGAHNKPTYVDAENYLVVLRNAGVSTPHIHILPDACVATSFDRGQTSSCPELTPIDAVLLGANGIYTEPEIAIAHTAGHLGVAISAKAFGVPVIVFSSTAKITDEQTQGWEKSKRKGDKWMTSDEEILRRWRTEPLKLEGTWNPREDRLPASMLTAIITERGIVRLEDSRAKSQLQEWLKELRSRLTSGDPIAQKRQEKKVPKREGAATRAWKKGNSEVARPGMGKKSTAANAGR